MGLDVWSLHVGLCVPVAHGFGVPSLMAQYPADVDGERRWKFRGFWTDRVVHRSPFKVEGKLVDDQGGHLSPSALVVLSA